MYQIILQPTKKLALWCDDRQELLCYDASVEEIGEFIFNQYRSRSLCAGKKAAKVQAKRPGMKAHRPASYWKEVAEKHKEQALLEAKATAELLAAGKDVYGDRAKTWDDVLEHVRETEGEEGYKDFIESLEQL